MNIYYLQCRPVRLLPNEQITSVFTLTNVTIHNYSAFHDKKWNDFMSNLLNQHVKKQIKVNKRLLSPSHIVK